MIRFLGLITTNTGNPSLWMFVGFNFFERSIIEPIFNFFYVIIITFGSGEDIESIIELHVEGEMAIVGKGKLLFKLWKTNACKPRAKQIDAMHDSPGYIAEFEEQWFGEVPEDTSERLVEVERSPVVSSVVYPDEHLTASFEYGW